MPKRKLEKEEIQTEETGQNLKDDEYFHQIDNPKDVDSEVDETGRVISPGEKMEGV